MFGWLVSAAKPPTLFFVAIHELPYCSRTCVRYQVLALFTVIVSISRTRDDHTYHQLLLPKQQEGARDKRRPLSSFFRSNSHLVLLWFIIIIGTTRVSSLRRSSVSSARKISDVEEEQQETKETHTSATFTQR